MPIKNVSRIEGVPGFENIEFTENSADELTIPQAVKFADEKGAILQSALEAAVFMSEADKSRIYMPKKQITRTIALFYTDGKRAYVAFDDTHTPSKIDNLLLSRYEEGYAINKLYHFWVLPKSDFNISHILRDAKENNRIAEIGLGDGHSVERCYIGKSYEHECKKYQELSTNKIDGVSEYGKSPIVRALFGSFSEKYASLNGGNDAKTKTIDLDTSFFTDRMINGKHPFHLSDPLKWGEAVEVQFVFISANGFETWPFIKYRYFFGNEMKFEHQFEDSTGIARGIFGAQRFSEYNKGLESKLKAA